MKVFLSESLVKKDAASKKLAQNLKANKSQLNKAKPEPKDPTERFKKYLLSWRRVHGKVLPSKNPESREKWHKILTFMVKYLDSKLKLKKLKPEDRDWLTKERDLFMKEQKELSRAKPSAGAVKLASIRLRRPKTPAVKVDNSKVKIEGKKEPVKKVAAAPKATIKIPALKDASDKMKPLIRKYREIKKAIAEIESSDKLTAAQKRKLTKLQEERKAAVTALKRRMTLEAKQGATPTKAEPKKPTLKVDLNKNQKPEADDSGDEEATAPKSGERAPLNRAYVKPSSDRAEREKFARTPQYRKQRDAQLKAARASGEKAVMHYDNKTLAKVADMLHSKAGDLSKVKYSDKSEGAFTQLGIKPEHAKSVFEALKSSQHVAGK